MKLPVALTIAGSDSGGGAGIQADLKTFAALGVHGVSAITAITAQNTLGVTEILEVPPAMVSAQIEAIMSDIGAAAAKTGMLSSAAIIEVVCAAVAQRNIRNLVVDPVMVAKGGARLLRDDAVDAMRSKLLPLAALVTPNLPEAEVLLGRPIRTLDERRQAAHDLVALGARAAVLKGGHADDRLAIDDRATRSKLANWAVKASGLKYTSYRAISALSKGERPGPENSIGKLVAGSMLQDIAMYAMDLEGAAGVFTGSAEEEARGQFQQMLLSSPSMRIAGGTDEILRNIIAERVLGLPGDIRVDKDVPFNKIPTKGR